VSESKARRECITSGRSREPPVFTRFGCISVETKFTRVFRTRAKAAPLQALGDRTSDRKGPNLLDDEDECEKNALGGSYSAGRADRFDR
jgi:hypothetical protein